MQITPQEVTHIAEGIGFTAYCFSHLIAAKGTPKWLPGWAVTIINVVATNYGKSKNADTKD
ncbi:hypothetical protein [Aquirhabdus parva]|uniref:Uncharacterized protein n=1 Tax=Aquirhabdus parva TaxID=2283318 RepID=A0A345PAS7_9GAMM|nr:hypothetical protein [Aquirhabdus parva]AXI01440.1 hypothetical protein HYN46_00095 [Aquirhabdus parva]AXI04386.1 hypothetical protein HYN46_17010 [Aquirhabdus parva]